MFFFYLGPSIKLYPACKRLKGNRLCQEIPFSGRLLAFVTKIPHKKLLVYRIYFKKQNPNPAWRWQSLFLGLFRLSG